MRMLKILRQKSYAAFRRELALYVLIVFLAGTVLHAVLMFGSSDAVETELIRFLPLEYSFSNKYAYGLHSSLITETREKLYDTISDPALLGEYDKKEQEAFLQTVTACRQLSLNPSVTYFNFNLIYGDLVYGIESASFFAHEGVEIREGQETVLSGILPEGTCAVPDNYTVTDNGHIRAVKIGDRIPLYTPYGEAIANYTVSVIYTASEKGMRTAENLFADRNPVVVSNQEIMVLIKTHPSCFRDPYFFPMINAVTYGLKNAEAYLAFPEEMNQTKEAIETILSASLQHLVIAAEAYSPQESRQETVREMQKLLSLDILDTEYGHALETIGKIKRMFGLMFLILYMSLILILYFLLAWLVKKQTRELRLLYGQGMAKGKILRYACGYWLLPGALSMAASILPGYLLAKLVLFLMQESNKETAKTLLRFANNGSWQGYVSPVSVFRLSLSQWTLSVSITHGVTCIFIVCTVSLLVYRFLYRPLTSLRA